MRWGEPHLVLSLESAQGSAGPWQRCTRARAAEETGQGGSGPGRSASCRALGGSGLVAESRCLAVTGGVWFVPEGERVINSR